MLKELRGTKTSGLTRAIGVSTHSVAVVREASAFDELDAIMTIGCRADQATVDKFPENVPLEDGSIEEMFDAMKLAHERGKGVIAIKVLGTGARPFVRSYRSSIRSIARLDYVDAMIVGMKSLDQVRKNARAILSP